MSWRAKGGARKKEFGDVEGLRAVLEEVYLSKTQIALDEAKVHEQDAIADCQRTLKVFKFKKYIKGYEDGKRRVSPKHSLDIGSFLKGEGYDPLEGGATHATEVESSLNAPLEMQCPRYRASC